MDRCLHGGPAEAPGHFMGTLSLGLASLLTLALALSPADTNAQNRGSSQSSQPSTSGGIASERPKSAPTLSPYSQGAELVIQRILAQSALRSNDAYLDWGEDAREALSSGEVFLRSGPVIDGLGVQVAGAVLGEGVGRLATAPGVIFEALKSPEGYPGLFEDVRVSTVHAQSRGGGGEHVHVYQEIDILGPIDAKVFLKLGARPLKGGGYFLWWDAVGSGMISDEEGRAISPNMAIYSGSWLILPEAGGASSVVYYTGITLPGYYLPGWLAGLSFVDLRVPEMFEVLGRLNSGGEP